MSRYAEELARYAREGVVVRHSREAFEAENEADPHRGIGPVYADYLEENDHPVGPDTLHTLRHHPGPLYIATVNGVTHAVPRLPLGQHGVMFGYLDPVTRAYADTAMWAESDENGESLDNNHALHDIADRTVNHMNLMTHLFYEGLPPHLRRFVDDDARSARRVGCDLWLTQHGHGAGFWDGSWGHHGEGVGDELAEHANRLPELNLHVGDDGKIHHA